ncbi:translocon-associated protein subunit alpha-like [Hydractinia symbiolongicarpus]|uniref:translocon-associated protein subunit alpha-like n=1 Tax=Hydractinia symbiolongicarpus TaxID=13093 RepID=UPI00254A8FD3|nr:translocon-associated protein subunit alpha-like [Hydractinia symbiolongicarpus]
MFKLFSISLLLAALIFPTTLVNVGKVAAQEDPVEDEVTTEEDAGEDSKVETEDEDNSSETTSEETSPTGKDAEEEEEKPQGVRPSPDAETAVLFTDYPDKQLPAGKPIYVLVGFHNKGNKDFIVETIDASFRYPQDYSYHIQNFTGTQYNRVVQSGEEASFQYAFHPHESYGGRPFGLTILMFYKDSDGNQYGTGLFNETVTFKEIDESFDGETFFLYVLLAAVALLVIFGLNYAFGNSKLKRSFTTKQEAPEIGTQNDKNNVDYDWLPKETTTDFSKQSPRRSPRQRRVKRSTGSGEE